jgi:hypothetical protein
LKLFKTSEGRKNMNKKAWIYPALTLGGGFLGGILAMQFAPSVASAARATHAVKAEEFVLVDGGGRRRGALQVTRSGMSDLVMYDGSGRDRAEFRVTKDGVGTIGFYGETGERRVLIGAVPNGRDGITIYGANNKLLAGLTVSEKNEASLTLYDPNTGRARAGLGVAGDGSPALALFDVNGKDRAELHVGPSGKPGLALADENGKTISGLPSKEASAR